MLPLPGHGYMSNHMYTCMYKYQPPASHVRAGSHCTQRIAHSNTHITHTHAHTHTPTVSCLWLPTGICPRASHYLKKFLFDLLVVAFALISPPPNSSHINPACGPLFSHTSRLSSPMQSSHQAWLPSALTKGCGGHTHASLTCQASSLPWREVLVSTS